MHRRSLHDPPEGGTSLRIELLIIVAYTRMFYAKSAFTENRM